MSNKTLMFTDIHLGKKSNSELHLTDCYNFVSWVCEVAVEEQVDRVCFLGDWFESRSAINILVLKYSEMCFAKLNALNIPIFVMVGNHDLYHKHTRDVHSLHWIAQYQNVVLVDKPTVVGDTLMCPFLFEDEYPELVQYTNVPVWMGHFEFQGFVLTGYSQTLKHGPDHKLFNKAKRIFSGHFHKRQKQGNTYYIGNTFPMDHGDDNDTNRGITIYDHDSDDVMHDRWPEAPVYQKVKLSELLNETASLIETANVKCIIDVPVTFEQSQKLKDEFRTKFNLNTLAFEESNDAEQQALESTKVDVDNGVDGVSVDDAIARMLGSIQVDGIDTDTLITIYTGLKTNG